MLSGIKLTRSKVELQAQKTVLLEIKRQTVGSVAASISRLKRKPRESLDVPQSACWLWLIPENWARPRSHASEAVDVVSRRHVHGIAFAFQAFDSQDSGRKQETKRRQRGSEKWEDLSSWWAAQTRAPSLHNFGRQQSTETLALRGAEGAALF
jgi:hypothetical protein